MIVLGFSGISNGEFYRERYGLSFVGHDAAVALVIDGRIVFAAEEERFTREKHTSRLPVNALRAALEHAGLRLADIDRLAYTWNVSARTYVRMCLHHAPRVPLPHWPALAMAGVRVMRDMMRPASAARALAEALGESLPHCEGVAHHMGHAAAAFLPSPFERAAVLTIDGQGEDESAALGEWNGLAYRRIRTIRSPTSIGILYGMVTDFLGMRAGADEYKVMAMAAEGDPARFRPGFGELVKLGPGGRYRTRNTVMVFQPGWCSSFLARHFGVPTRDPRAPLEAVHFDLAAALQETTERVVQHLLAHLRVCSGAPDLCMAGGVALNSVLNGKVLASGLFERVWIPSAPGDHGGALGAALLVEASATGRGRIDPGFTPFLGTQPDETEILVALNEAGIELGWTRPDSLVEDVAERLARGELVGWVQGRMEYGPRALGHRSLLASPIELATRVRLNEHVKHRESFRPFAASVPIERARELFEISGESPYMQFVVPSRPAWRARLAAVDHHGRTRVQTVRAADDPLFHALLLAFERRSGVPALLNTSFNDREPIVRTAREAVATFVSTPIDALALGPFLVRRAEAPAG